MTTISRKRPVGLRFLPAILIMLIVTALGGAAMAAVPAGTGGISGVVYFDANGNGVRDGGEAGVAGATVTVVDVATEGGVYQQAVVTVGDGAYAFGGLDAGDYRVTETDAPAYVSTTANVLVLNVGSAVVAGQDFGDALSLTVTGIVYDDLDASGDQGLGEPGVADALVEVLDASAQQVLGSDVTDDQGAYIIPGILPGARTLRVQPPGGSGGTQSQPVSLISSQLGGNTRIVDVGLPSETGDPASVAGVVWNDADGDEVIDGDEARLGNVGVSLFRDEIFVASDTTDGAGQYGFGDLEPGAYRVEVDDLTLPAGWVASGDPANLSFALVSGQQKTLDLGYYDPLLVAPLRLAEWKKEFKQAGHPHYTPAELAGFVAIVEADSPVFSELVGVAAALEGAAPSDEAKARKQAAALRLNVASQRLLPLTPVNLPDLTQASTVAAAVAEVDGLLYPPAAQTKAEYKRAEAIADALNNGKGLGYGLSGVARVSQATYNGNSAASALQPAGSVIDAQMSVPIYVQKWSPGSLPAGTNIFQPQLRLKVQRFDEGGVLEIIQRLSDGREASLGVITPSIWNKDVKATYLLDLWRVASLSDLAGTEVRINVLDVNAGKRAHVKVDSAEVIFGY
ncbi:MAG: hypothetical protein K1X65_02815 [Caldilineales bacterium]|nr:hypothetical protein [Caldilineales bacterium]